MRLCRICARPLKKFSGQPRNDGPPACFKCQSRGAYLTERAEREENRELRKMFETPARVWAAHTMERER